MVESGTFTVLVDGKPVSQFAEGNSFGELALLYNSPRQATVRADTNAVVYSLDRDTYRFLIAQSSADRTLEIKKALNSCPLLAELTEDQLEKVSEAVELFSYNAGAVNFLYKLLSSIINISFIVRGYHYSEGDRRESLLYD